MTRLTDRVADQGGHLTVGALATELGEPEDQVLVVLGLTTSGHPASAAKTQHRLREVVEILERTEPWAGSLDAAWHWYVTTPIPALSDTPAALVRSGRADEVLLYIEHIADGGYA